MAQVAANKDRRLVTDATVRDLIVQIVLDLFKNTGETASKHAPVPHVAVERMVSGRVRTLVSDNGPEALVDDVFLPFFTTKMTGAGMGLSTARQIVTFHKGVITMKRLGDEFGFEIVLQAAEKGFGQKNDPFLGA